MPFYELTVPAPSPTARLRAEVAAAITRVHAEVTGAPEAYVNVAITVVPPGSLFAAGREVEQGRLVGTIRSGRPPETKRALLQGLADAWSQVTGEPVAGFALFLHEIPGSSMMEDGQVLPEASQDPGAR